MCSFVLLYENEVGIHSEFLLVSSWVDNISVLSLIDYLCTIKNIEVEE